MKNFIGVDFSISSPAITIIGEDKTSIICCDEKNMNLKHIQNNIEIEVIHLDSSGEDIPRFARISQSLLEKLDDDIDPEHTAVAFENYAFGASGQLTRIAEACGILKHEMYLMGFSHFFFYSPKTVKKHMAGNGNANKHDMVNAFHEETGLDLFTILSKNPDKKSIDAPITDIADSYWVAQYLKRELLG